MPTNVREIIKSLPPARRKKIETRKAQLAAEEMSLRNLRQLLKLTQERIAETLQVGQERVSRIEGQGDLRVSTVRSYVEAMGGRLSLLVEFPDRDPVLLSVAALERNYS
jgi:reverse gyrase